MRRFNTYLLSVFILLATSVACNTPLQSQKFFAQSVKDDPILEPLHQTALYTVYFDHALRRCVLHSSYTWGESGGGTGGTGLGVNVFNCNPRALKAHVNRLRDEIRQGITRFELPQPRQNKTTPERKTTRPERPGLSTPQAPVKATPAVTDTPQPSLSNQSNGSPAISSPTLNTPSLHSTPETAAPRNTDREEDAKENKPTKPTTGTKLLQPVTIP
jgi:hypothetical protein